MSFGRRRASRLIAWSVLALGAASGCTFPDFHVASSSAGASSTGATSSAGSGGAGDKAGSDSGAQPSGGSSSVAGKNTGGTAGTGGDPLPVDIGPCGQRVHPTHCWNRALDADEGELDVDCGGRCAACAGDEACKVNEDCATGTCTEGQCARTFSLQYVHEIGDEQTPSLRSKLMLTYAGKAPLQLSDVEVRYYFARNSVTEPLLPGGSVFELPSSSDVSGSAVWGIQRLLRSDGLSSDAYLSLGFKKGKIVTEGTAFDITATTITGDGTSLFNQKTHYSFDAAAAMHETKKITVFVKGQRVWGSEPPIDDPPSCLHLGVNLDGTALTIDDESWLGSPASVLDRYIDNSVALYPATPDKAREEMVRAGFFFHDDSFSYPVENGSYSLLAYAWSANGSETGTLSVQGEERDTFHARSFAGASPWAALGPYRVSVTDGALTLAADGDLRIGGVELRLLDE
jgi:hypothetical protein